MEKYKERKRMKKLSMFRNLILLCAFFCFLGGLSVVDNSFRSLMCIEDKRIFDYQYTDRIHAIHLFGDDHKIKQEDIDKIIYDVKKTIIDVLDEIIDKITKIQNHLQSS